jgi:hypothetical protein
MTSRGKFAAVGMAAVLAVGGATVAVGQGTGGTVGPKAQGSTSFEVRIKTRDVGCDKPNVRQCFNRPKLGAKCRRAAVLCIRTARGLGLHTSRT